MTKQIQNINRKGLHLQEQAPRHLSSTVAITKLDITKFPNSAESMSVQHVPRHLGNFNLSHIQRQLCAEQLGRIHGNRQLGKIVNKKNLQRIKVAKDEAAYWYKPWIRDVTVPPGSITAPVKIESGSKKRLDTGWKRNALDNAVLAGFAGVLTGVIAKRIPKVPLLEHLSPAVSALMAYDNIEAQDRVWGDVVNLHSWYGKYRYNIFTKKLLAVRFDGKGSTSTNFIIPYNFQQRIADKNGKVLYKHTLFKFSSPGVELPGSRLPEKDVGNFNS